jgi:hypothetical protein
LSFQVKSWGKNKLTIGREGFAVPEHFPTFKIFFPRLEGPFRRVASLAEIIHPLLWIDSFEKWKGILNPAEIESEIKVSNEKGGGKKPEKGLHKYH